VTSDYFVNLPIERLLSLGVERRATISEYARLLRGFYLRLGSRCFHAMQDMPDTPTSGSKTGNTKTSVGPPSGSRTVAGGREFVSALGSDFVALANRLSASAPIALARAAWRLPPTTPSMPLWVRASGKVLRRVSLFLGMTCAIGMLAASSAMLWALHDLPLHRPMDEPDKPGVLLEAANGEPLGRVGPLKLADVELKDFSPILIQAVLSTEDRRFYQHFGVDLRGILRAAHRNAEANEITEGGSTITQQLVKMRYVGKDRTYIRKLREALTAIWLESRLGKDEILTQYLNSIYMGAGTYGLPAAAWLYFNKHPNDLTLAEAAMLAGLIKAPSQFNPLSNIEAAQARAATVLDAMVADGVIDSQAANLAKAHPATPKLSPQLAQARSWFADWIKTKAAAVAGPHSTGVRLRTTLMPELQRLGEHILDKILAKQGRRRGASQGALVAMRPDGAVLAMVGGRNYRDSQFNRAVDAHRQPGSAFKLFVYLAALRNGFSPQDMIDASPVDIKGWKPENYGNARFGRMTVAEAFARSVNTAAVRLAMDVGLDQVIAAARDLGIDTPLSPYPSLALGAAEMNLLDLTSAFASVRADRMRVKPWGIAAVGAPNGSLHAAQPLAPAQTLDPYQKPLIKLLRGVVEHGTGRAAALNGFAAGKTGTSEDYRDAWFIGFNDTLVVGVWIGNDDNSPMKHVVGGSLPASIWKEFISKATPLVEQQGTETNRPPSGSAMPLPDEAQTSQAHDRVVRTGLETRSNPEREIASDQPSAGHCDQQACASAYNSFRASDCTYQPYSGGPRRLCEKGHRAMSAAQHMSPTTVGAGIHARCNVDACARAYSSFNPSDCTYQPFGGGSRQLCEK
jgi:1A family penicillin-binding protein